MSEENTQGTEAKAEEAATKAETPLSENEAKRQNLIKNVEEGRARAIAGESETNEAVTNVEAHNQFNDIQPNMEQTPEEVELQTKIANENEKQSKVAIDNKEEETPETTATEVVSGEPEAKTIEHPSDVYDLNGVPTVKLKVDGEILEMPLDRVKSIVQKNILVETKMRKVVQAEKDLGHREQMMAHREQEFENKSLTHPPTPGAEPTVDISNIVKETANVLFDGNKEEAETALTKLVDAVRGPTVPVMDSAQIDQQIERRAAEIVKTVMDASKAAELAVNFKADLKEGLEALRVKFPDVLQDDVLFSMVDARSQVLGDLHPDWSPQKVMMAAAEEVNGRISGEPKVTTPAASPDRQARKEGLTIVPSQTAHARTEPAPKEPDVDTTPLGVIERMKNQRGAIAGR